MSWIVQEHPELLIVLFPIVLAVFSFLFAHLGSWSALAAQYRDWNTFEGRVWRSQTGQVGMTNYGSSLNVGANDRGLHLSVVFLLRLAHPPLFFPWDDISATEGQFLFSRHVDLQFRRVPGARVRLRKRLADEIRSVAGMRWPTGPIEAAPIEPG